MKSTSNKVRVQCGMWLRDGVGTVIKEDLFQTLTLRSNAERRRLGRSGERVCSAEPWGQTTCGQSRVERSLWNGASESMRRSSGTGVTELQGAGTRWEWDSGGGSTKLIQICLVTISEPKLWSTKWEAVAPHWAVRVKRQSKYKNSNIALVMFCFVLHWGGGYIYSFIWMRSAWHFPINQSDEDIRCIIIYENIRPF